MNDKNKGFIKYVIREIPELKPLYEEHLEYHDDLLPYVIMDEISNFVIDKLLIDDVVIFQKFSTIIENEFLKNNPEISGLISTSFCETIDSYSQEKEKHNKILNYIGKETKKKLIY